jgi:hypothetical protein
MQRTAEEKQKAQLKAEAIKPSDELALRLLSPLRDMAQRRANVARKLLNKGD